MRRTKRSRKRKNKKNIYTISAIATIIIVAVVILLVINNNKKIVSSLTLEAGTERLNVEEFLIKKKFTAKFVTDTTTIDLCELGEYEIEIECNNKIYKSNLIIKDTISPNATGVDCNIWVDEPVEASLFVKDIIDFTDVTVTYKDTPDFSKIGTYEVVIVLEDKGGNLTEISSNMSIVADEEPPLIEGVKDITVNIGETVKYKQGITITDNKDTNVELIIDNSKVNLNESGKYKVVYSATDSSGNTATKAIMLTVKEKSSNSINENTVNQLADSVLAKITNNSMTAKDKAYAIYKWTKSNINYINTSQKDSVLNAAYQGLNKHTGDCYVYFAVAKFLLTRANIENIDIVKSDTSVSRHYWNMINCGSGWYHFDTTPRKGGGEFFMLTDSELDAYSIAHNNSHIFDAGKYPETPTE